jgi:hypothetical protein
MFGNDFKIKYKKSSKYDKLLMGDYIKALESSHNLPVE